MTEKKELWRKTQGPVEFVAYELPSGIEEIVGSVTFQVSIKISKEAREDEFFDIGRVDMQRRVIDQIDGMIDSSIADLHATLRQMR